MPTSTGRPLSKCNGCGRTAAEIEEYKPESTGETGVMADPERYVWSSEGTLNRENGHFYCTTCYIKIGMPSAPGGWKAP